tara:strand:+ start:1575 stop:1709 length:135 start_codon:yes stop_codon:yes gene_type:complete
MLLHETVVWMRIVEMGISILGVLNLFGKGMVGIRAQKWNQGAEG